MRSELLSALAAALTAAAAPAQDTVAGDLLVVANKQAASVTVLDARTGRVRATLAVGAGPHEVAASADGRLAVVTNYGAQTAGSSLSVIDLDRMAVVRTIELGEYRRPHGIAFLPGTPRRVAVTSEATRSVVLVDVASGRVEGAIPTGEAGSHMLAVSPDGRRVYTANIGSGTVSVLDVANRALLRTSPRIAPRTEGIALSADGRRLWVGSNDDHTVTVLDAASLAPVDTLPAPGLPYRAVASADGRYVVVPNPLASVLRVFDAAALRETAAIHLPPREGAAVPAGGVASAGPVGVALSADGRRAFVSLQERGQVGVVELERGVVAAYWEVGAGPDGIAFVARGPRR